MSPANPVAGQSVVYSATVKNQGTASTPSGVVIGVLFTTDGQVNTWSDNDTASLAPGASVTLTANGGDAGAAWSATAGSHSVNAFVNDVARFAESNTSNNQLSISFTVGSSTTSPTATPSPTPTATSTPSPTPTTATGSVGPYGQDASLYTLTFQDEFDGSSLDYTKWNDHIWYDSPSSNPDFSVANGALLIFPQPTASGTFPERIITTKDKFQQTYGYFEIEAKLPIGKGCWPAFWLLNSDNPSAGEPEIDVLEAYSGDDTGYWADSNHHPIRFDATFFQTGANTGGQTGHNAPYTGDLSTGFHKYALKWEASKLTFYFDGNPIFTPSTTMSRAMYILLDMQYGSASGTPDSTTPLGPSNAFTINYVRAWQFK